MISDILSDAVSELRRYMQEQPEVYADTKHMIDPLINHMDALRAFLDSRQPAMTPEEQQAFIGRMMAPNELLADLPFKEV